MQAAVEYCETFGYKTLTFYGQNCADVDLNVLTLIVIKTPYQNVTNWLKVIAAVFPLFL